MSTAATAPRWAIFLGQLGVLAIWLIAWQIVGPTQPVLLSSPVEVAGSLATMLKSLRLPELLVFTGRDFLLGWIAAVALGLVLGTLIGWFRTLALMFEPFINALYSTPKLVLIPLMILWFGLDLKAYVAAVVVVTIFPITIMTITGIRNAGREYVEVARSFRVRGPALLFKVVLPGALPFIAVGLRLSLGAAIGGAIGAEFFLGGNGIGSSVSLAGQSFQSADMYAFIIVIAASAIFIDSVMRATWTRLAPVKA